MSADRVPLGTMGTHCSTNWKDILHRDIRSIRVAKLSDGGAYLGISACDAVENPGYFLTVEGLAKLKAVLNEH